MPPKILNVLGDICPQCESRDTFVTTYNHKFKYGIKDKVELTAKVPLKSCNDCGFQYLDWEAEIVRRDVVIKHLESLV